MYQHACDSDQEDFLPCEEFEHIHVTAMRAAALSAEGTRGLVYTAADVGLRRLNDWAPCTYMSIM